MIEKKTCSRPDCTKVLRSNNTTGRCATGCQSPDAPGSSRAKGVEAGTAKQVRAPTPAKATDAVAKMRKVAEAIGKDPDELLAEFAQAWLDGLREALEG